MAARKYTNIQFEDIRSAMFSIMKAKGGGLEDMSESSYGRLLVDLFAGTADLMAFYAESSFQNAFLETAKSLPAIYAGSRMLGYSPRRPVPAKAGVGIQATTTGQFDTIRVFIPKGTEFGMGGLTLTAMDDMEFSYDRNLDVNKTGLMTLVSGKAVLAEGRMLTRNFVSNGKKNQTFILDDASFSDYFGDGDPNFADDGNVSHRKACFTTVTSDATLVDNVDTSSVMDDRLYWRISRRGLADPAKLNSSDDISAFIDGKSSITDNYTVNINTANDGTVQIKFGDGLNAAVPYGVITVAYFSTNGESGNLTNVAGTVLSSSSAAITITQADGSESDITLNDLNIALTTDVRGGQDMESADSIKNNAPIVYNTLDRLVNDLSYKVFLRRYADIKYATAFGEDVLNTKLNGGINVKYMNQVRFSALKDLYRERDGVYYPTTSDEYFLDGFKVNGLMYTWEYDFQNVGITGKAYEQEREAIMTDIRKRMKSDIVKGTIASFPISIDSNDVEDFLNAFTSSYLSPLIPEYPLDYKVFSARMSPMDFVEDGSELHSIMVALNRRGMLTVGGGFHSYVYPSVHNMQLCMDVKLFKGNNFTDIRDRIKNVVYGYLKDNTEFATAIYKSKIASLVHTMVEVAGVDVWFEPVDDGYRNLDLSTLTWMGNATQEYIVPSSVTMEGGTFYLQYGKKTGNSVSVETGIFTIPEQSGMASRLATFYDGNVRPHVEDGTISDKQVDSFVAYIWEQVMQQVFTPVADQMESARLSGDTGHADTLYALLNDMKCWDMQSDTVTFKDSDKIVGMEEVNGSVLYGYMRYGMEYIKLVRNALEYYITKNLVDDNGNITRYTNQNEIVQIVIPTEKIAVSVAYDTSLITDKD